MKVLILGIAGGLARRLAQRLLQRGDEVAGIDARPWPDCPGEIRFHQVDIRKRDAEDVFRHFRPDAAIHMATVTSLMLSGEERHRINLLGTRAVFSHCQAYGVKQALFIGRHTYYGTASDAALYHTEDEPPQGLSAFPQLADLVASDLYAATALWRMPSLETSVLRVCYTLGASGDGTLASFLKGKRVPMVLGFDPLFQFLHEEDAVTALTLALDKRLRGIFNIAGPPPVPLSLLAHAAGRRTLPLPQPLLRLALGRRGLPRLPQGAIEHLKFPVVVDAAAFRKATGFSYAFDETRTLEAFRAAHPPPEERQ